MPVFDEAIHGGHYAKKQILCKDWLISWSHRRRFNMGLLLAQEFAGKRVLDYGCGDGTFLAMLMALPTSPAKACGAELLAENVKNCRDRLRQNDISFVPLDELDNNEHRGAYDAVVCMEVLEHVIDVEPVFDRFVHLLAPAGKLLISVPVETGVPLLIKQAARRIAGWRGIGDYPGTSPYSFSEYGRGFFAGRRQRIARPVHIDQNNLASHDHKGFTWMALRETLARRFRIERTLGSPVPWLTPHLASQVWFIAVQKS